MTDPIPLQQTQELSVSTPTQPEGTPAEGAEEPHCENCQARLTDAFCAVCGQERRSPVVSVRAFARQWMNEIAHLDSRLLRTLRALFFQPGHLTCEYLNGRRVRYTQPLHLYFLAAAAFFLVASYRPFLWIDTERLRVIGELPLLRVGNTLLEALLEQSADEVATELFAARFASAATGVLPVFLVGSVVLFSLVVHLVNRTREPRYVAHAIFALHWSVFFLLLLALARLLPAAWQVGNGTPLLGFVYLTLALRRVHGQGIVRSAAKGLFLTLAFLVIMGLWVQSAIVVGLMAV